MSPETQPLPVEIQQPVNSTAQETSPLHATGSAEPNKKVRAARSRRVKIEITEKQLAAIQKKYLQEFPPLSWDATDEEEAARSKKLDSLRDRPGRELVFFHGMENGKLVTKSRWVAYDDFPERPVRATRRQTSQPRNKKSSLRPVAGTYWRSDGDGWELRKSGGAKAPDKDKYLGRLSGKAYAKMKAEFQGEALAQALCEWAVSKAAEKGIEL